MLLEGHAARNVFFLDSVMASTTSVGCADTIAGHSLIRSGRRPCFRGRLHPLLDAEHTAAQFALPCPGPLPPANIDGCDNTVFLRVYTDVACGQ